MGMETTVSAWPEVKTETRHLLKLCVLDRRKTRGWCECDACWAQEHSSSGDGANKEPCDMVASHPLLAGLFKEISAKYPELAALVPQISKVARAAVATPKSTATLTEQREESLQALRKATSKSASAEGAMRKHSKKLGAAKKTLEDVQAKTAELMSRKYFSILCGL